MYWFCGVKVFDSKFADLESDLPRCFWSTSFSSCLVKFRWQWLILIGDSGRRLLVGVPRCRSSTSKLSIVVLYVSCFEIGFSVADFWCDYLVKGKLNARGFKSLQSLHKDRLLLRSVMLLSVDLASSDADLLWASLLQGESNHLTICIRIACFEHAYVVIWGCLAKGFRSLEDNYRHSVDYLQPLYQTVSRTFCKLFADMQQVSLFHVFFLWFQIAAQMQQLCISMKHAFETLLQ